MYGLLLEHQKLFLQAENAFDRLHELLQLYEFIRISVWQSLFSILNWSCLCFIFWSAIYVVDLDRFRRLAAGDRLRGQYQVSKQLSTDLETDLETRDYLLSFWFLLLIDLKICPILTTTGTLTSRNVLFLKNSRKIMLVFQNESSSHLLCWSLENVIMNCWFVLQGLSQDPNSLSNLDQVGFNALI